MLDYSKKQPLIFNYKKSVVQTGHTQETITRPVIPVRIGKSKILLSALVDTGSDKTISFMKPFGNMLGIDIDSFEGEPDYLHGLFGSGPAWPKHTEIWIGSHKLNVPVFWLTKPFDIERDYQVIIGRKIIFDNFDVVFKQNEGKVYFYFNR